MSKEQVIYILIAFSIIILINWGVHFIKNQKVKDWILITFSILPIIIEWTLVYKVFLNNNCSTAGLSWIHLFPVYFCNFIMYMLIVVALWPHKNSKIFNCLATFVAWSAIFGGVITNFTTYYNLAIPDFSHSIMILAGVYLFVGKYAKINVYNVVPFSFGLLFTGLVGVITRSIFVSHGLDVSGEMGNCMYMYKGVPGFEIFNGYILALLFLFIIFIFSMIWEFIFKKKECRWYKTINDIWLYIPKFNFSKNRINNTTNKKNKSQVDNNDINDTINQK